MNFGDSDGTSNPSANPLFADIRLLRRRQLLKAGIAGTVLGHLPGAVLAATAAGRATTTPSGLLGFSGISAANDDIVRLPSGYTAELLFAWGDPVSDGPAFRGEAANSADEQALQAGMHHDGVQYFPLADGNRHGLLCINHEYCDDGLLHPDGMSTWSAAKVAKAKAAHGVSIIEIKRLDGRWQILRPSRYGRRITADTPIALAGPAAGSPALQTAADPLGKTVLGTLNNCGMGTTPWGTLLTCEENFNAYFKAATPPTVQQQRYGIEANGGGFRWHEFDERFDTTKHPNEANRFGWVVEIDPRRPESMPVKRTALGRFKHESAFVTLSQDRRVVVYMGDDERFEYIYKFVSRRQHIVGQTSGRLLDDGTLYVARFDADGSGRWLALTHGLDGLTERDGFADQAEVLVRTREAADRMKATRMDRPEWIAVHPDSGEVYCTLTNNSARGSRGAAGTDAANPRAGNLFGHILRWRENGGDAAADGFSWEVFIACGDPKLERPEYQGSINGDLFASPDGAWFDAAGRLWLQTDVAANALGDSKHAAFGNNQMLVADPQSGEVRRFLTGPRGCEITGLATTPDGTHLFVNIQHPGEPASGRSDPTRPTAVSAWPGNQFPVTVSDRPRSATLVIRRSDGGVIGAG